MVHAWLADKSDDFDKRHWMWMQTAKKKLLGEYVYDMAMERHKALSTREWRVAYLISAGYTQPESAKLLDVSVPTIEATTLALKQKIKQDFACKVTAVRQVQIVRWFLGL